MNGLIKRSVGLAALLFLTAPWLAASPAHAGSEPRRTVTVNGAGMARGKPDRAEINAGAVAEDGVAARAMAQASKTASRMQKAMTDFGVKPADISTGILSLAPVYRRGAGNKSEIAGYRAAISHRVVVRAIAKTGLLIDALVKAGASSLGPIRYYLSDETKLKDAARASAMGEAERTARLLAERAGMKLGSVLKIKETSGKTPRRMVAMASAAVPVMPGEVTARATVTVVYLLSPGR